MNFRENKQLSYWVENQRKCFCQFLRDEHTPPTLERKSALENIEFFWKSEKGCADKGPIRTEKLREESKM